MIRRFCTASAASALLLASNAQAADTVFTADISAGVGYSRNPFSGRTDGARTGSGSGFYEAAVRPRLEYRMPTSTLSVTGNASYQEFFGDYRRTDSYGAGAGYDVRLSERLNVGARLNYDSTVLGNFGGIAPMPGPIPIQPGIPGVDPDPTPIDPGVPVDPGVVIPPDLGLFGTGNRRNLLTASGNVGYVLSALDTVTVSAFYSDSSYSRVVQGLGDFHSYGATLGYQRRISESLTLGLQGSGSRNIYPGEGVIRPRVTSDVQSIQGTVNWRINERWSLNGGLGMSFIQGQQANGSSSTLSGNARLCRRGELDQLCASASRSVVPTAFAGTQTQTLGSLSYTRRLDARSSISFDASYTINDAENILVPGQSSKFAIANVGYTRQLGPRLRAISSIYYRDVSGGIGLGTDYGGRIGLGYLFGGAQ